jgi:N-acetylated-alpha-linked acidic dipeptidase
VEHAVPGKPKQTIVDRKKTTRRDPQHGPTPDRERTQTNQRRGSSPSAWYKYFLDAPGVYTGYEPKTVPGVREGIELKNWFEAEQEIARVGKALRDESALVESAAQLLETH